MAKNNRGCFVCSIDGPDFSGKTTVASLIVERLVTDFPQKIILKTQLPSNLITGAFTKILRNSKDPVSPEVLALVYAADHLHHYQTFIKKNCNGSSSNGAIIVQERSLLTTFIYQAIMGNVDMKWLEEINKYDKNIPDLQIILKVKNINSLVTKKEGHAPPEVPENQQFLIKYGSDVFETSTKDIVARKQIAARDFDLFETKESLIKQTKTYNALSEELKNKFNVAFVEADKAPREVATECINLIKQKISQ